MGSCEGRVAFVTGASRGIGKAIAQRLSAEGACVVVCASRMGAHGDQEGTLEQTVSEIQAAGGKAFAIAADLASDAARADLVERAEQPFGPLDILVNNAAMGKWAMPSQSSLADRRAMFEVNVNAPVDLAQQALPGMRARRRGWVLNLGSATALQPQVPYPDTPEAGHVIAAYGASKAALHRYTEALAHEVAGDEVFVNALAPVAIVLTQGAAEFVGHIARRRPDMAEPLELMVEAALELVTGRHVGEIAYSRPFLHRIGRPVRSLDGKRVVGDAQMPVDLDVAGV